MKKIKCSNKTFEILKSEQRVVYMDNKGTIYMIYAGIIDMHAKPTSAKLATCTRDKTYINYETRLFLCTTMLTQSHSIITHAHWPTPSTSRLLE